jgi:hypothetical protein
LVSTFSDEHFRGEITVAARIIDLLSSGLYESPAACLKELINNSFDADARNVDVFVKPDANRIIIQDDGHGMNREEFERHFRRIAESHKRDDNDTTASGRPKIGKIGIGVIAANELCERLEIFSTKTHSPDLLHVTIDFEEMRKPADQRKKNGGDFVKADCRPFFVNHIIVSCLPLNRVVACKPWPNVQTIRLRSMSSFCLRKIKYINASRGMTAPSLTKWPTCQQRLPPGFSALQRSGANFR